MAHSWAGWPADVVEAFGNKKCAGYMRQNPAHPVNQFLLEWGGYEESPAQNNPLNTNRDCCGGTICAACDQAAKAAGIKDYPTPKQGAQATAGAIKLYPGLSAILSDCSVEATHIQAAIPDLKKWGSINFADKLAGGTAKSASATESAGAADWTSFDLGSLWNGITDWLSALKNIVTFAIWLLQPKHWIQALEVLAGVLFFVLGMRELSRVFSASNPITRATRTAAKVVR